MKRHSSFAYHRRIRTDDDIAARLERLFDEQPSSSLADREWPPAADETEDVQAPEDVDVRVVDLDERIVISGPDPPHDDVAPLPAATVVFDPAPLVTELHAQMDALRDQLKGAFKKVIARVGRVENRVAGIAQQGEAHAAAAETLSDGLTDVAGRLALLVGATDERLEKLTLSVREILDAPISSPDLALEDRFALLSRTIEQHLDSARITAPADDLSAIEEHLERLTETVEALASRAPAAVSTGEIDDADRSGLEARLDRLTALVEEHSNDARVQIATGLTGVRRVLRTMEQRPAMIDERAMEDITRRALLPNYAETAKLREEVSALAHAVRQQEAGIGELRTTLDWIQSRLLLP